MARIGILVGQDIEITGLDEDAYGIEHRRFSRGELAEIGFVEGDGRGDILSCDEGGAVLRREFHVVGHLDDGLKLRVGDGVEIAAPLCDGIGGDNGRLRVVVVGRRAVALVGKEEGGLKKRLSAEVTPRDAGGAPSLFVGLPGIGAGNGARGGEGAGEGDALDAEMADGVHLGVEDEEQAVGREGLVELEVDNAVGTVGRHVFLVVGEGADDGGVRLVENDGGGPTVAHGKGEGERVGIGGGAHERGTIGVGHVGKEVEGGGGGIVGPMLGDGRCPTLRCGIMGGPLIEKDGIGIGRAAREGSTLGEVLKTKRAHAARVALRIVGLVGVGAR